MGKIYYIMGKSGSGKDTVFKQLQKRIPSLKTVIPYTTRPIRDGETQGVEYHFITQESMEEIKQKGRLIEERTYDTICGSWSYLTVDDGQIDLNQDNYLMIGTLESYEKLRVYFGQDRLVPLYLQVEDGLRLERVLLRERGQKNPRYKELCRRYLADDEDFKLENLRRLGIHSAYDNSDLSRCLDLLTQDILRTM